MNDNKSRRPSPIAGEWYTSDPEELRQEITGYIDRAAPLKLDGEILALVSPHAGYFFSGGTAGYSYRCVQGKSYDLVVVASPLHEYHSDPFLTTAYDNYWTPLGDVPVAHDLLNELDEKLKIAGLETPTVIRQEKEHSLEIQLPFLQCALTKPFELLPLMVRESNPHVLERFARSLAEVISGKSVLLVASTDLAHYLPEDQCNMLDENMLAQITALNPAGALDVQDRQIGYACGVDAVALILWTAKALGARKATLLHHTTSAEANHKHSNVVGYAAVAITK